VHPNEKRKGIASFLIQHALDKCNERGADTVYVEASICARPVFEKIGFQTIAEKEVKIGKTKLINFNMELNNPY